MDSIEYTSIMLQVTRYVQQYCGTKYCDATDKRDAAAEMSGYDLPRRVDAAGSGSDSGGSAGDR